MNETSVPAALLCVIKRDLRPVRPLASPVRRALALIPLGLLLYAGMPAFWKWQMHVKLAPWTSWSVSVIETALSLIVLAAAFREAVPGRELSGRRLGALVFGAAAGFLLVNANTQTPASFAFHTWLQWLWECLYMTVVFSIPALLAPAWLVARALPNRPALAGALCGLGVGLMADAGLRLICWDAGFAHLIVAHGGAIVLLAVLGAASASFVERVRSQRRSSSRQHTNRRIFQR